MNTEQEPQATEGTETTETNETTYPTTAATAATSPVRGPAAPPPRPRKPHVRTGPIVWGALILAFCGYVLQRTFAPGSVDTATWVTSIVLGLGALLLVVGITVAIRGRHAVGSNDRAT